MKIRSAVLFRMILSKAGMNKPDNRLVDGYPVEVKVLNGVLSIISFSSAYRNSQHRFRFHV